MAEVRLESITKVYPGKVLAVDDLSLDIRDGELLVLVGPIGLGRIADDNGAHHGIGSVVAGSGRHITPLVPSDLSGV